MKILFVIFLLLLFVLLLSLVRVKAYLTYDNEFGFVLKYGIIKLYSNKKKNNKKESVKSSVKQNNDDYSEKLKGNISTIKDLIFDVFLKFKKHLVFDSIELQYDYGFNDAAVTGVFYGVASSISNIFLSYMDNTFKVKNIVNEINPDFNNPKHKIIFKAKFGIRLIYLFSIAIKFMKFLSKLK